MLEGIYCGRESPIYHYRSQVIKINGQKIIKMISLFIVLSCSWGNPTLKGSAGVLKMGIWSPWRLLWVNLPYDKKQKIKIVFKLPKLLKTIFYPFASGERSETHQLQCPNPLHVRPLLQSQSLGSPGCSLLGEPSPSSVHYHSCQRRYLIKGDAVPQTGEKKNDMKILLPF